MPQMGGCYCNCDVGGALKTVLGRNLGRLKPSGKCIVSKKMKIFETSNGREWVGMRDCCLEMLEKTEMFAHYSPLKLRKSHREKPKGP